MPTMRNVTALCVLLAAVSVGASAPRKQGAFLAVGKEAESIALGSEVAAAAADATEAADAKELGINVAKAALALQQASTLLDTKNSASQKNATGVNSTKGKQLTSELANLRAVYDTLKKGIVRGNTHEGDSKKDDAKRIQDLEVRIGGAEKELNATNASAPECDEASKRRLEGAIVEETHDCFRRALLVNRTKSDRVELNFWKGHRESSHSIFHNQLKMAHGMMDRIKQLTDVYESVLAGKKVDNQKLARVSYGLPTRKAANSIAPKPAANSTAPKPAATKVEPIAPKLAAKKPELAAPNLAAKK